MMQLSSTYCRRLTWWEFETENPMSGWVCRVSTRLLMTVLKIMIGWDGHPDGRQLPLGCGGSRPTAAADRTKEP